MAIEILENNGISMELMDFSTYFNTLVNRGNFMAVLTIYHSDILLLY